MRGMDESAVQRLRSSAAMMMSVAEFAKWAMVMCTMCMSIQKNKALEFSCGLGLWDKMSITNGHDFVHPESLVVAMG
jgi:hypothetical protein